MYELGYGKIGILKRMPIKPIIIIIKQLIIVKKNEAPIILAIAGSFGFLNNESSVFSEYCIPRLE